MACLKLAPYVLQELPDITDAVHYPIRNIQRVKYTCFDVSKSLIAFGATSGGIYVFNRAPCEFLQLIPNKDGAITRLAISLDEKHIAFANGKGYVTVTQCDQSLSSAPPVLVSKEHQGNEVTTMVWSGNNIFTGDDVGKLSVLQLQSFIAKTMFHQSSQTIMCLDSRICQVDVKDCMLVVSTLTRCYICDTSQEQYRQIGQKQRDGEFGACFVNYDKATHSSAHDNVKDFKEAKTFNIVEDDSKFAVAKGLENTAIYCARPSSRLWEATVDGAVKRTHQYKQVLGKGPIKSITTQCYENQTVSVVNENKEEEGQSVNFSKIHYINGAIFSFKKDALYFLDIEDVDSTVWSDSYKDIIDCKLYKDFLYLWLSNGFIISLRFMKIERFLVKCYVDEKYDLCAEFCALYRDYLLTNNLPTKLHILVGLKNKLQNDILLESIIKVLDKFESLKAIDATQMKTGIYVVDNTYNAQSLLLENDESVHDDTRFGTVPPDTLQTLRDLSSTVTDKLTSSKKILKEKWGGFEDKMKHFGSENSLEKRGTHEEKIPVGIKPIKRISFEEQRVKSTDFSKSIELDNDIIYKESSQKAIEIDNNSIEKDKVCKSLYQYFRLSLVGKEPEKSNLITTIESYACDISQIYQLMLLLEQYCLSIEALEESKFVPNNIFLSYLSISQHKDSYLESIINNEDLYKYFVDSCISVNMKIQKLGCQCGFPLPYNRSNQTPVFSDIIDLFIEKQWSSKTRDQCYDICRRMPYLWRKIVYLRRNDDLMNLLRILLQMLDENILHSFLPQFTLDTWDRAIQLYATLHANICLNCNKRFDNISVKETLDWDDIGALIIKSIGGKNAIKLMEKHANLIDAGDLSLKFYHTSLIVAMYEKFDATITSQLTDALYSCYEFENCRKEIYQLLRKATDGCAANTALPLVIAAKSLHWGFASYDNGDPTASITDLNLDGIVENLPNTCNGVADCSLCGLPLKNEILIKDGGLWAFKCGHTFHGPCLNLNKLKLCPSCSIK